MDMMEQINKVLATATAANEQQSKQNAQLVERQVAAYERLAAAIERLTEAILGRPTWPAQPPIISGQPYPDSGHHPTPQTVPAYEVTT